MTDSRAMQTNGTALVVFGDEHERQHQQWLAASRRLHSPRQIAQRPLRRPFRPSDDCLIALGLKEPPPPPKRDFIHIASSHEAVIDQAAWVEPPWRLMAAEVAAKHDVTMGELLSARRDKKLVNARHELMWRMAKETPLSLPQIGKRIGGRDHTTVLYGIRKYEARMKAGQV